MSLRYVLSALVCRNLILSHFSLSTFYKGLLPCRAPIPLLSSKHLVDVEILDAIRLINTRTMLLEEYPYEKPKSKHVALSQTWSVHEVTFNDFGTPGSAAKAGWRKITYTCE